MTKELVEKGMAVTTLRVEAIAHEELSHIRAVCKEQFASWLSSVTRRAEGFPLTTEAGIWEIASGDGIVRLGRLLAYYT